MGYPCTTLVPIKNLQNFLLFFVFYSDCLHFILATRVVLIVAGSCSISNIVFGLYSLKGMSFVYSKWIVTMLIIVNNEHPAASSIEVGNMVFGVLLGAFKLIHGRLLDTWPSALIYAYGHLPNMYA